MRYLYRYSKVEHGKAKIVEQRIRRCHFFTLMTSHTCNVTLLTYFPSI